MFYYEALLLLKKGESLDHTLIILTAVGPIVPYQTMTAMNMVYQ